MYGDYISARKSAELRGKTVCARWAGKAIRVVTKGPKVPLCARPPALLLSISHVRCVRGYIYTYIRAVYLQFAHCEAGTTQIMIYLRVDFARACARACEEKLLSTARRDTFLSTSFAD